MSAGPNGIAVRSPTRFVTSSDDHDDGEPGRRRQEPDEQVREACEEPEAHRELQVAHPERAAEEPVGDRQDAAGATIAAAMPLTSPRSFDASRGLMPTTSTTAE